jgi:UDP-N-acetylmuramoyl-L-alanyl-D-glutamate--2,6-diaminopimelate ligase
MRLDCLAPELANAANGQIDIRGLTADSRAVMPGYLFAALAGSQADGVKFIDQAIARGAHAVLVDAAIAPVPLDGAVEGSVGFAKR